MVAFEKERAESGEPDLLSASDIATSVWNTLNTAGITVSADSFSTSAVRKFC